MTFMIRWHLGAKANQQTTSEKKGTSQAHKEGGSGFGLMNESNTSTDRICQVQHRTWCSEGQHAFILPSPKEWDTRAKKSNQLHFHKGICYHRFAILSASFPELQHHMPEEPPYFVDFKLTELHSDYQFGFSVTLFEEWLWRQKMWQRTHTEPQIRRFEIWFPDEKNVTISSFWFVAQSW